MEDFNDMAQLCRVYKKIDAHIAALKKEHAEALVPYEDQLKTVSEQIKQQMLQRNEKSVRTDFGTAVLSKKTTYYAQDREALKTFIIDTGNIDFLQNRLNQSNVQTYVEEHDGLLPPGAASTTEYVISVRKPAT